MDIKRQRVFFALWPDDETSEHLHALAHDLTAHARVPGRVTVRKNLHMTLAFVGAVDNHTLDRLGDAAGKLSLDELDVSLDRLGFWPRGGVVYAGGDMAAHGSNAPLLRVFSAMSAMLDVLGLPHDHRPATPHVTLAHNVRGIDLPRLGSAFHWHASEFALVRSELHPSSARYETLACWPMRATDN